MAAVRAGLAVGAGPVRTGLLGVRTGLPVRAGLLVVRAGLGVGAGLTVGAGLLGGLLRVAVPGGGGCPGACGKPYPGGAGGAGGEAGGWGTSRGSCGDPEPPCGGCLLGG
ncbi:hypothetical protein [Streptomyces somaliensis]|uniref:hypothetical protein n=1 Tax=Streptomyces somaliensis TaxID=78355 RepID=UPI003F7537B3